MTAVETDDQVVRAWFGPAVTNRLTKKQQHFTDEQIEAQVAAGEIVVPESYMALDVLPKKINRGHDQAMGEGERPWMPQRRVRRPSAPRCWMCRNEFVSAPGEPCETCWEECRFEHDPIIGRGSNSEWPDTDAVVGSRPEGSRRRRYPIGPRGPM